MADSTLSGISKTVHPVKNPRDEVTLCNGSGEKKAASDQFQYNENHVDKLDANEWGDDSADAINEQMPP